MLLFRSPPPFPWSRMIVGMTFAANVASISLFLWPPYGIGQAIIFLFCGFFYLSDALYKSTFYLLTYLLTYLSFFFSSYNLSRCRLDICHTSARHQTAALRRGCHLYSTGRPTRWALAHILAHTTTLIFFVTHTPAFMAALRNMAGRYIFVCGFFFLSFFLLSFFYFSSPLLSRRKLDVYNKLTSTHDVALLRI